MKFLYVVTEGKLEVKFNNGDFDFYHSGVMVLERLKNGVSSRVRAFTHKLFYQSFRNFNMLLLMTNWRSSSIMTIVTFTIQELWFLKDRKMEFPVVSVHLCMNCST